MKTDAEWAAMKDDNFVPKSAALTWTTEKPSEPGWYWIKRDDGSTGVRAVTIEQGRVMVHEYGQYIVAFAGPIAEPEETLTEKIAALAKAAGEVDPDAWDDVLDREGDGR